MLCLFMTLLAMARSESLHELFHPDAQTPGHSCCVTLLQHNQIEAADIPVNAERGVQIEWTSEQTDFLSFTGFALILPPSCGPPPSLPPR
jgi:hypothetical protein